MIKTIDNVIEYALIQNWTIKYIALSTELMRALTMEVMSTTGKEFTAESLSMYRDIPLKTKDIVGFQVSYDIDLTLS